MTGPQNHYGQPIPGPPNAHQQAGFADRQPFTPKKKRAKWPWIVLGVFLTLFLLVGGCVFVAVRIAKGPIDATNEYVAAIDAGNFQPAYDSQCSEEKSRLSFDEWLPTVEGNITSYNFSFVENSNGRVRVSGTLEIDGVPRSVEFRLVKETGEWRVCGQNIVSTT